MLKFLRELVKGENGKTDYGRRAEDMDQLEDRVTSVEKCATDVKQDTALIKQEQEFAKERHEELKYEVKENRRGQQELGNRIFQKFDELTSQIQKNHSDD